MTSTDTNTHVCEVSNLLFTSSTSKGNFTYLYLTDLDKLLQYVLVDLFQEISPRIAKQLRFQVKLHHFRWKCKNDNPGFFANGIPAMKKPDALQIFLPKFFNTRIIHDV
jgi:hypothetical protein